MVEEPRKEWELRMEIAAAPRSGAVVATLRGAVVRRGAFTLGPVDLQIDWADRVAITGRERLGQVHAAGGAAGPGAARRRGRRSLGPGVVVGEVDQARGLFLGDGAAAGRVPVGRRCRDLAGATCGRCWPSSACAPAHVLRPAATLSPGERTRAALALLQARGVNLLVLDEPTNHLDLPAIEQLEAALATYPGTLLLVTHDRRMLDAVHVTRRLEVEAGKVTEI